MARLRLPRLPERLRAEGFHSPPYRQLHDRAVDGRYPAEQADTGLWYFDPARVLEIAQLLELKRIAPAPAARRSQRQPVAA